MVQNKVTDLRSISGITTEDIQQHINENNADGWELIQVDNLIGWYRFFWKKTV